MEYKSNASEVILNIKQKLLSNESQQALIATISQAVYASNQKRVFTHGLNIYNSPIGKYSTKPTLVGAKSFANKTSADEFFKKKQKWVTIKKKGKNQPLAVLKGGYAELRALQGKSRSVVNLTYTGSLFSNFQNVKTANGYTIGFLSKKKGDIAEHLEEHFDKGRIFGITQDDRKVINEIVKNWIKK
jgi:hypothetical protein